MFLRLSISFKIRLRVGNEYKGPWYMVITDSTAGFVYEKNDGADRLEWLMMRLNNPTKLANLSRKFEAVERQTNNKLSRSLIIFSLILSAYG